MASALVCYSARLTVLSVARNTRGSPSSAAARRYSGASCGSDRNSSINRFRCDTLNGRLGPLVRIRICRIRILLRPFAMNYHGFYQQVRILICLSSNPSSLLNSMLPHIWRRLRDSNPRYGKPYNRFRAQRMLPDGRKAASPKATRNRAKTSSPGMSSTSPRSIWPMRRSTRRSTHSWRVLTRQLPPSALWLLPGRQ